MVTGTIHALHTNITNMANFSHNTTHYFTHVHEVTMTYIYNYPQGSLLQRNVYKNWKRLHVHSMAMCSGTMTTKG